MVKSLSNSTNSITSNVFLREILYTLWGVFLLFLTSQITIPLEPVPITLQTYGVMLVALTFPRATAINSHIVYLVVGGMGVPVFAGFTGGLQKLVGPSGGYLFGFLAAVAVMGIIREHLKRENFLHIALNCFIGTLIIFAFGIGWLATTMGIQKAIQFGFIPFIIPGIIKIALLAVTLRYLKFGRV